MKNSQELNGATLEAVVKFAEELDHRPRASIEEFLLDYPQGAPDLRLMLETIARVRNSLAHVKLSPQESTDLFSIVENKIAGMAKAATKLDRRPDAMILLLHLMREVLDTDIWGDTKLVKLLFLLGKEGGCDKLIPDFYGHYAYSFGAFDSAVPEDAKMLAAKGIITMSTPTSHYAFGSGELGIPNEKQVNNVYRLTPKGKRFAHAFLNEAITRSPKLIEQIKAVVLAHGKKTTDELLRYTYTKYPETAEHSKVKDKYLKKPSPGTDNGF